MKRVLNTLYITTQGAYLSKQRETVLVKVDGEVKIQVPIHTLCSIVCYGNVAVSPFLLGLCSERGVSLSFMTERGRYLARLEGATSGNVLLRREQYRAADDSVRSTAIAKNILCGKIANARTSLQRHLRDNPVAQQRGSIERVVSHLASVLLTLPANDSLEQIRGHEGESSRCYFSVFDQLVVQQKDQFYFSKRSRRPPLDNMNALLSFIYTLLLHDARSACESVGLDPAVGFLHRDRPGRPSLALDLMEELRPFLADRLALSLINRRQVDGHAFQTAVTGGVLMTDEARKKVLVTYQKRKQEGVVHPFIGEKMPIGVIFELQARLLARHLRGELDAYPPFFWK